MQPDPRCYGDDSDATASCIRPRVRAVTPARLPGHLMFLHDALCEVYPLYRNHAAAMETVARFIRTDVWIVAERLHRRAERRPRLRRVI